MAEWRVFSSVIWAIVVVRSAILAAVERVWLVLVSLVRFRRAC